MISAKVKPIKKKKKTKKPQPPSFSSLPDEITEVILARVSRWNYPSLSLVCKRFRFILSWTQIYKTRSQIGTKEICIYVSLWSPNHASWISIWTKPNQTLTKGRGKHNWFPYNTVSVGFKQRSSGNLVVPIPLSSSPILDGPTVTLAVGSEIYVIGGPYKKPSSSAWIFDCRSHTWRDAPNMNVARQDGSAVFFDGKIYVMGGCHYCANWFEVFDIKTQSWTALPCPIADYDKLREYYIIYVFQGKLYVETEKKDYTYEPKDGTWKVVSKPSSFRDIETYCVIENVICGVNFSNDLMWSDSEGTEWREIKGLEKLHKHRRRGLRIVSVLQINDYGGKLLVMWDPYTSMKRKYKIWYAIISLESRCNGREVWGNVEFVDALTFHYIFCIV